MLGEWSFDVSKMIIVQFVEIILWKNQYIRNQGGTDPNTCVPVAGVCGHCYHSDCINEHVEY